MTTLTAPVSSSASSPAAAPCHSGRSFTISAYRSTQMRRLMQTTMPFIGVAGSPACRPSKWSTRSLAISARRRSVPTIASMRAHLLLSFSRRSTSVASVTSSNSASTTGFCSSGRSILARRPS